MFYNECPWEKPTHPYKSHSHINIDFIQGNKSKIKCQIVSLIKQCFLLFSFRKILKLVEVFGFLSAAKLNKQKTFGMWLGKWRGRLDEPVWLKWLSKCNKCYVILLGIKTERKRHGSLWQHQGRLMYGTPNISRPATAGTNSLRLS